MNWLNGSWFNDSGTAPVPDSNEPSWWQSATSWWSNATGMVETVFWVIVAVLVLWIFRPLLVAVTRKG